MAKEKLQLMAQVLLDAVYSTDKAACQRWSITDRTLRNYRKQLVTNAEFSVFFHTKRKEFEANWTQHTTPVLVKSLNFLEKVMEGADERQMKNPQFIEAVTETFRTVAEVQITANILDAQVEAAKLAGNGQDESED